MQLFQHLTLYSRIDSSPAKERKSILSNRVQPDSRLWVALFIAIVGLLGFLIVLMIAVSGG